MKQITRIGAVVLCCVALSHAASVPGADGPLPDETADMDAMTAHLVDPTELALHAVRIPKVVWAQAWCLDCIASVQDGIAKHAPKDAKLHPQIVFSPSAVRYLVIEHTPKSIGPLLTYGARNVSALHLIRLIEGLTELRFVIKGEFVVVERKPANKPNGE